MKFFCREEPKYSNGRGQIPFKTSKSIFLQLIEQNDHNDPNKINSLISKQFCSNLKKLKQFKKEIIFFFNSTSKNTSNLNYVASWKQKKNWKKILFNVFKLPWNYKKL